MNLKQLQYFIAVVEEKQITAAAKKLNIAQPPLSYQLKQLEAELETRLFTRTAHGIVLTDAGMMLEKYARKILDLTTVAKEKVKKTTKGELGKISLGTVSSSAAALPIGKLKEFRKYYPEINFEIFESNTYGILEKLFNGEIDLGLVRTPFNQRELETKIVMEEPMVAVVNSDDYLKGKKKIGIDDLEEVPLIIYRRFENIFRQTFSQFGINPYIAVKCDDARTAIYWAKLEMGVALVPASCAKNYTNGRIIPINYPGWNTQLTLIWLKNSNKSPLILKLIELFSV